MFIVIFTNELLRTPKQNVKIEFDSKDMRFLQHIFHLCNYLIISGHKKTVNKKNLENHIFCTCFNANFCGKIIL